MTQRDEAKITPLACPAGDLQMLPRTDIGFYLMVQFYDEQGRT